MPKPGNNLKSTRSVLGVTVGGMDGYESKKNLAFRCDRLLTRGHDSSVWGYAEKPTKLGHVIELLLIDCVSKPCWDTLKEAADLTRSFDLDHTHRIERSGTIVDIIMGHVFQFYFKDLATARKMATMVLYSAKNLRKDRIRAKRINTAGGSHDKAVIERLFDIQNGRCYYSGDILTKRPKNYSVDHIIPVAKGGVDWPVNLALVLDEINTWKGGHATSQQTLLWLSRDRGKAWLKRQKAFCSDVDRKRADLDDAFRRQSGKL